MSQPRQKRAPKKVHRPKLDSNQRLRAASGSVNYDQSDRVTAFLYTLMRDHMPAGDVEKLVVDSTIGDTSGMCSYTNGWLAQYAKNLATRLRNGAPI